MLTGYVTRKLLIVWNVTLDLELAWITEVPFFFLSLSLCSTQSILNSDWANLTFRGREAGLFDLRRALSWKRLLVDLTHLSLSLSPSPIISDLFCACSFCASLHTNFVKKLQRFTLFWRLKMYFPHCLGMGVDGLLIFTSRAVEAPLLSPSQNFVDVSLYLSKTMWTSKQSAVVMGRWCC